MNRFVAVFLVTLMMALSVAPVAAGPAASDVAGDSMTHKDLATVRQATAQYHDVENAIADGYVTDGSYAPGMGYHYVKAGPYSLDAPNVLVYAEKPNGDLKLVAVEYVAPYEFEMFGQHAHEIYPGAGLYGVHVWAWQANPDGIFHETNPNID